MLESLLKGPYFLLNISYSRQCWRPSRLKTRLKYANPGNGFLKKLEVVFLHFRLWVADLPGFDVKFVSSMSKSPRGQVLSWFHFLGPWAGLTPKRGKTSRGRTFTAFDSFCRLDWRVGENQQTKRKINKWIYIYIYTHINNDNKKG